VKANEFSNLKQGSCSAHVDPVQFYGASKITLDGNYIHDTSTGLMSPDGNGSPFTLINNVFVGNGGYAWAVVDGGGSGDTIRNNTFAGGWTVEVGRSNSGQNSTNETITDNVITGGVQILSPQPSSGATQDYNMIPGGGSGTHTISGSPTFVGGSNPTSWGGYRLAPGSVGTGKASDGTDIGIG
jgi:hypothetical protein